jgi:hypothetical protein
MSAEACDVASPIPLSAPGIDLQGDALSHEPQQEEHLDDPLQQEEHLDVPLQQEEHLDVPLQQEEHMDDPLRDSGGSSQ